MTSLQEYSLRLSQYKYQAQVPAHTTKIKLIKIPYKFELYSGDECAEGLAHILGVTCVLVAFRGLLYYRGWLLKVSYSHDVLISHEYIRCNRSSISGGGIGIICIVFPDALSRLLVQRDWCFESYIFVVFACRSTTMLLQVISFYGYSQIHTYTFR